MLLNAANYFTAKVVNPSTGQATVNTYQQREGLAMGTNAAPQLANIWLAMLETANIMPHIVAKPSELASSRATDLVLTHYSRFIDDIFILALAPSEQTSAWIHSEACNMLHSLDDTVQMTLQIGQCIQFLDVEVHYQPHSYHLAWKPYSKPINNFLHIPTSSNHPPSTFKGFYCGIAHRLALRSSSIQFFLQALVDAAKVLAARGHSVAAAQRAWNAISYRELIIANRKERPRFRTTQPQQHSPLFIIVPFDSRLPASTLSRELRNIWKSSQPSLQPMLAWLGRTTLESVLNKREARI